MSLPALVSVVAPAFRLRRSRSPASTQSEACLANGGLAVSHCRECARGARLVLRPTDRLSTFSWPQQTWFYRCADVHWPLPWRSCHTHRQRSSEDGQIITCTISPRARPPGSGEASGPFETDAMFPGAIEPSNS